MKFAIRMEASAFLPSTFQAWAARICLILPAFGLAQTHPNKILIRSYSEPGFVHSASDHITFKNGMGQEFLSLVREGTGDIASGRRFDRYGRTYLEFKPFYSNEFGHNWNALDVQQKANEYYNGSNPDQPNGGGYAFRQLEYFPDPLKRVRATGEPGTAFRLGGGRETKFWYLGVSEPNFLSSPNAATLDAWRPSPTDNFGYFLEVVRDPNGNFAQVIKDKQGRVLKTWSDPSPSINGNEIVTQNVYDGRGNLIRTLYPGPGGQPDTHINTPSTYVYSSDGKLLAARHPDEGLIEYVYDNLGRLRFTKKEKQRYYPSQAGSFSYTKYDAFGRDVEHGLVWVPSSQVSTYFSQAYANNRDWPYAGAVSSLSMKIKKVYDRLDDLPGLLGSQADAVMDIRNLRGRLAAVIAYDEFGQGEDNRVVDVFSYDQDGRVESKTKFVPTLGMQEFYYNYDLQGRLTSKWYVRYDHAGQLDMTYWQYKYDANGRLLEVQHGSGPAARYTYSKTGRLTKTEYLKNGSLIGQKTNTYTIRDWIKSKEARNASTTMYSENLTYEGTGGSGARYDGSISVAQHFYAFTSGPWTYSNQYGYDGVNRLISNTGNPPETYQYDAKGRLIYKTENYATYGPYVYGTYDNRLSRVGGHPTRNHANGTFVYDPDGNMVFDRSKKMAITYDWRGLPYRFSFYSSVPDSPLTWDQVHSLGPIQSEVEMIYDADGQRVLKRTKRFN